MASEKVRFTTSNNRYTVNKDGVAPIEFKDGEFITEDPAQIETLRGHKKLGIDFFESNDTVKHKTADPEQSKKNNALNDKK
jgi:hypothetical protein